MPGGVRRDLAHMLAAAMNAFQQGEQRGAKNLVIMRTAAPSRRFELHILYPARGAGQSRQFICRGTDLLAEHRLHDGVDVELLLLEQLLLLGALVAKVPDAL